MTEFELLTLWAKARTSVILSQLAPTFLLAVSVWLLLGGLHEASLATQLATIGILLASGILGALVQYQSATQAMAVADQLAALGTGSAVSADAIAAKPWLNVVRFVTPAVFVLVFLAELWAILID